MRRTYSRALCMCMLALRMLTPAPRMLTHGRTARAAHTTRIARTVCMHTHSDKNAESTEELLGWPRLMHAILLAPEHSRPTKRRRI